MATAIAKRGAILSPSISVPSRHMSLARSADTSRDVAKKGKEISKTKGAKASIRRTSPVVTKTSVQKLATKAHRNVGKGYKKDNNKSMRNTPVSKMLVQKVALRNMGKDVCKMTRSKKC